MKKLEQAFYCRDDVVAIAKQLLGKVIWSRIGGQLTAGRIVETEAYAGIVDRASHAFGDRRTERTEVMYGPAGRSYIYLCYGIHQLFNVVTNEAGIPHAVLIRALEPVSGIELMAKRRAMGANDLRLTSGPGKLSVAMGWNKAQNNISLQGKVIWIEDQVEIKGTEIGIGPRIGVGYAGEDTERPWRFWVKGNSFVSV